MTNIYALRDPTTNKIRYVGKTKGSLNRRYNQHVQSRNLKSRTHSANWINSLMLLGLRPGIELLEKCDDNIWQEREIYWISKLLNEGEDLTNISPGGDSGCTNYKHSLEARARISLLNSRPKSDSWIRNSREAVRRLKSVTIEQYSIDGQFIREWPSIIYAAEALKGNVEAARKNIHACCKDKRRSAYGYKWKYKSIELQDKEPIG